MSFRGKLTVVLRKNQKTQKMLKKVLTLMAKKRIIYLPS